MPVHPKITRPAFPVSYVPGPPPPLVDTPKHPLSSSPTLRWPGIVKTLRTS